MPANYIRLDSEANLQAEFYHACRLIDLPCALEVTTPAGRHDAVILSADRRAILAIIEVNPHKADFMGGRSPQITRYKSIGAPVYGLSPEKDPHRLAATLKERHANDAGVQLAAIIARRNELAARRRKERNQLRYERLKESLNIRPPADY